MKRKRGFTLIELLIVMLIISVLAAILFPVFAAAREKARQTSCLSNVKQLGQALQLYAQDWHGSLPPTNNEWGPTDRYVRNRRIYRCPDDEGKAGGSQALEYNNESKEISGQPSINLNYASYIYRAGLANDGLATEVVAFDRRIWHNGGLNVLFLDASARWFKGSGLSTIIAPDILRLNPQYRGDKYPGESSY
jgi:prepilin-type N-terminal cleavage/methylation domain-containing protein/prepilin-type processing-associated H-X9-DG protein